MPGDWSRPAPIELLPGRLLADSDWLGARIDETGRFYRTPERSTLATLWWYSASAALLGPCLHALVTTGQATSLAPDELLVTLTPYGYPQLVRPAPGAAGLPAGPEALGAHLDLALAQVIVPLAAAGQVPEQRLWAVAADALGTRLIVEQRPDVAARVAAGSRRLRPVPKFLTIGTGPRGTGTPLTLLRRASCCMLFRVPDQGLCISCPRQLPAERLARLTSYARSVPDRSAG